MVADVIGMVIDKREAAAIVAGLSMLRTPACWHGSHAEKFWGQFTLHGSEAGLNEEELHELACRFNFYEDFDEEGIEETAPRQAINRG